MKPLIVAVVVALLLGMGYEWRQAVGSARKDAAEKGARDLVATNRAWLTRVAQLKQVAADAKLEATAAMHEADSIRDVRTKAPALPKTATASDSSAFWHTRAMNAERETWKLRVAYEREKVATAALTPAADTSATRLEATGTTLTGVLDRDRNAGRISLGLFSVPKPPKLVAAAIGCLAGALLDRRDALRGCGAGGTVAVVVAPTR